MNKIDLQGKRHSNVWVTISTLLTLMVLLGQVEQAQAQWTTNGTNINNTNTGNVGIGTANPAEKLTVSANAATTLPAAPVGTLARFAGGDGGPSRLLFDAFGAGGNLTFRYASNTAAAPSAVIAENLLGAVSAFGYGTTGYSSAARAQINFFASQTWTDTAQGAYIMLMTTPNGTTTRLERVRIDNAGNVGIGTIAPGYKLDVNGAINAAALYLNGSPFNSSQWTTSGTNVYYASGNVGIGTTTPGYKLDINGAINATTIYQNGSPLSGSQWTTSGNNVYYTSGSVGIGATSPGAKLDIIGPATGSGPTVRAGGGGDLLLASGGTLFFDDNYSYATGNYLRPVAANTQAFFTAGAERMRVTSSGNVGIGNPNPAVKLDVSGDVNATGTITGGNIAARYQDVAEWVPSTQKLAAGTVVVLDTEQNNHVIACLKPYDTRVAGVISERPGLTLGEAGKDRVLVATTGRVQVKVDATRAPIHVGDLLVTSDVEGVAMKSEAVNLGGVEIHRPGTLIGKALEPLEKGVGEILVLLSLQ